MDKLQWLKERQKGIGGSDVGAIMGVNKWKSPFEVYVDKTEEIREVKESGESSYFGNTLEEVVAREFSIRSGKKVRKDKRQLVHKIHEFMMGNIDRRIVGENSLLECTTVNAFRAKEWDGEEIPPSHILQCQHYMEVLGADTCYIAALIGGQRFVYKEIKRDEELISMIVEAEKDFWFNHVQKRIPPKLDGSEAASKYLSKTFKSIDKTLEVNLKEEYKDKINEYLNIKNQMKILDESLKVIENNLKNQLGNAEKGIVEKFQVIWKGVTSNRIDSKVLKEKYPEIYKEVCKQTMSRRFEIKEISS
ncbi:YqaJ viral recombinase family protein [Clostridium beijerinckii]|uniref:Phage-type endonuclease n=1 Tax=Clostridium beijerinckii TaxID=1520 RepID=A0AAX0AUQ1_CLOBE|nr:YqaJ viral recombinase family protein [Clostridium beijerinckii]NRT86734.1 putative phage-type endonuclease [Clostridium beijerinckii]NYC72167.1 putative phage-type endonuclease [Clostridium beijerinckii]